MPRCVPPALAAGACDWTADPSQCRPFVPEVPRVNEVCRMPCQVASEQRVQEARAERQVAWVVAALVIAFVAGCGAAEESRRPPNIVLIVADDLGYGDLGTYGSKTIPTPHIDSLAADGVRLTDGYVSAAVCSPTRAGLMTGRYQSRFGYEYNPTANYARGADAELGLPEHLRTLGDLMRDAGYATAMVGKWHLGVLDRYHPLNRGFDEFFGILGGGTSYIDSGSEGVHSWPRPTSGDRSSPHDAREVMDGFEVVKIDDYLTNVLADKAVDFIQRHADRPFFLMLTPNAPHTPIQATSEYFDRVSHIDKEGARIFAAMVSALDDMVGDVMAALREFDIERNTLVVFLSDNGCINYMPDVICTNAPLSGAKRYHLEGGTRVPFIVKWPAGLPQGAVYEHPAIALDLYATFGAAAGIDSDRLDSPDSVNLLPHLRGERDAPPHEYLFWRSAPNLAVRWGRWKLWRVDRSAQERIPGAVGQLLPEVDYPPVSPHGQITVLHDLSVDIGERENVIEMYPEVVERLDAALESWTAELSEPLWTSRRSTLDRLHGETIQLYF